MTMLRPLASRALFQFCAVLASIVASACGGSGAATSDRGATAATEPLTVDVANVVEQPLNVELSLPGELTAFQSVAVYPRVSGFVKTVHVDRGSRVRAGDVLVTLEAPEVIAQRAEAQSKLQGAEAQLSIARAKAEADRGTYEKLKAASGTPGVVAGNELVVAEKAAEAGQSQIVAAQHSIEAARQSVNALRDMEAYLRLTAPFDGVITERNVHPGALVGPANASTSSAPLLRLVQNLRLRLVVPVPEAYTSEMKAGTVVAFTVAAYPAAQFSGTVARISDAVDVTTRTMAVELDVSNKDARLAPGAFCQVKWPIRRSAPSLFVPATSVATTTDRIFVIRVRDGKTDWVDVKTGLTSGSQIEVFGDLHAGDRVVARATDELRSGTQVRAREGKPAK